MITPDLMIGAFAQNGDRTAVPATDPNGFINFNQGYTPFYELSLTSGNPQAKAVERRGMNQLFYQLTQNVQSWQQQSYAPWISGMPGGYEKGAYVTRTISGDLQIFRSVVDGNMSDPATNSTNWQLQPIYSDALARVPMPAGGTGLTGVEIINTPVDVLTLPSGTYELSGDAIAAQCQNLPNAAAGGYTAPRAGMLEIKKWMSYGVMRYTDLYNHTYTRCSSQAGVWRDWQTITTVEDEQVGNLTLATVTQNGNAFTATTIPAFTNMSSATFIKWNFSVSSPAAAGSYTLDVNGMGPIPLLNQVGGNLNPGDLYGMVILNYRVTQWRIVAGMGQQYGPNLAQTNAYQYITKQHLDNTIAALGKPQWSDIQNKPNVVINNDLSAKLQSIELGGANLVQPSLDFHYNNGTTDFDARIVQISETQLDFRMNSQPSPNYAMRISSSGGGLTGSVDFKYLVQISGSMYVPSNQRITWLGLGRWHLVSEASPNTGDFILSRYTDATTFAGISIRVARADGLVTFEKRPYWGFTPWDNGNFDPTTKITRTVPNETAGTEFNSGAVGLVAATPTEAINASLKIANSNIAAAASVITFERHGQWGLCLGIDSTDNQLRIGGYSMGLVSYPILHTGNLATYLPNAIANIAYNGIGSYGLFLASGSGSDYTPMYPGTLVAGSQLYYNNCQANIPSAALQSPPGTWRCMSHLYNYDGRDPDAVGVFQRVS